MPLSDNQKSRSSGLKLAALLLGLGYVLINLAVVTFVPVLHKFTMTVTVLDAATSQPVQGATVALCPYRSGSLCNHEWGKTNSAGQVVRSQLLQENPYWVWPTIGRYRNWTGEKIVVLAPGYVPTESALPDLRTWAWSTVHAGAHTVRVARRDGPAVRVSSPADLPLRVGQRVELVGTVTQTKCPQILGVDVGELDDHRGRQMRISGILRQSVVTQAQLDEEERLLGGEFAHRGPGIFYRLDDLKWEICP